MVHKIIKMGNKLLGEGEAIQCHGPSLSGKGWQGVGGDKNSNYNPPCNSVQLQLCCPIPKGPSCSTSVTRLVALQASNTSPSLSPFRHKSRAICFYSPASIWEELKVITQSAATCDVELFNWE